MELDQGKDEKEKTSEDMTKEGKKMVQRMPDDSTDDSITSELGGGVLNAPSERELFLLVTF